jgi:hypothetical protein
VPPNVDHPKSGQGGGYAVQLNLKSRTFLLELTDYRLHQGPWHPASLSPVFGREWLVRPRTLILGSILGARVDGRYSFEG